MILSPRLAASGLVAPAAAPYVAPAPVGRMPKSAPQCGRCKARHFPRESCTKHGKGGYRKIIMWRDGVRLVGAVVALALACSMALSPALAQRTPVYQTGVIGAAGNIAKFYSNGLIGSGAGLSGDVNGRGVAPFSITDSLGLGLCSNSGPTNAAHWAFCIGHDSAGNALLAADAYGGAAEKSIFIRKNGTLYEFPFALSGIVGPVTSVVNNIALFNNTTGSLLKDSGLFSGTAGIIQSADTSWLPFGVPALLVTKDGGESSIVGFAVGNTFATLPAGTVGYGKVTVPSATAFGIYGLGELSPGVGQPGQAIGGEFTCRNNSGTADGTKVCNALQVTAGGAYSSGVGIFIGLELGAGAATSFKDAINIKGDYNTSGITIQAPATGSQYAILAQGNGTGINTVFQTTGAMVGMNAVLSNQDANGLSNWSIRQNGASFQGMLAAVNYGGNIPMASVEGQLALNTFASGIVSGVTINSPGLWQGHARGTQAAPTTVAVNDVLASYVGSGYDGADYQPAVRIRGIVDGTVSAGVVPGRMVLETADAAGAMTIRATIDKAGLVAIAGAFAVAQATPAAAAACTAGQIVADTGFFYACTATGVWKRVAITGGY